jgi:molybdenum cofactor synthesis domain-containing protein
MPKNRIVFVATGSELVCGSVINTSSPWMAEQLFDCGYESTEHRVVSDNQADITQAIQAAMEPGSIVVVSGGLGPTSDDRTRFAFADALGLRLEFNESAWAAIEARFQALQLTVPENNRSQAMLPKKAAIFANKRGTAAGCYVEESQCHVFMLPGPPNECRPMFSDSVLPIIKELIQPKWLARKHWFLLGTSEGSIADVCDPLIDTDAVEIGYRVEYPYLELKLFSTDSVSLAHIANQVEPLVDHCSVGGATASAQLHDWLAKSKQPVALRDSATGGRLLSRLLFPSTQHSFHDNATTVVTVRGLEGFWAGEEPQAHALHLDIEENGKAVLSVQREIPHRGLRSLELASEWVCWEWLKYLIK